jgi:hypothetical protein
LSPLQTQRRRPGSGGMISSEDGREYRRKARLLRKNTYFYEKNENPVKFAGFSPVKFTESSEPRKKWVRYLLRPFCSVKILIFVRKT